MNKIHTFNVFIYIFFILQLSSPLTTLGQGQCNAGGCAFGGSQYPSGTFSSPPTTFTTVSTLIYGGEYQLYSVVSGTQYEWTYCTADGANAAGYDLQLTLFNNGTTAQICYSDDFCGTAPKIQWTATFTGTVRVLTSRYSCLTQATSFTLRWRSVAPACTPPAAPTAVSATPATICSGASSNLRATSAGNTIRWYTVATGGTNIGTSASGANFAVSPASTTTYYAEAFTAGGCASATRTSVVVNVGVEPSAPTNVTATPAIICTGASSNLNGTSLATGFTGLYAPANWTISRAPASDLGSVNTAGAPTSITMTSSNGASGTTSILYTVNITVTGSVSFNWSYTTTDGASYDYPQYAINGVIIGLVPGFSGAGGSVQSGVSSIAVTAGQTFSLVMTSVDNFGGAATTTFSSFSGPGAAANSVRWYTVATGGTPIGTTASGANFSVTPAATTTYYAEGYSAAGCASTTRTAIIVEVEVPTTPNPVTASPSTLCVGASTDLMAVSGSASAIISGFTGDYAPANWTISHVPSFNGGTVSTAGAPASISMTSSDASIGTDQAVWYTVTVIGTGNITFDWDYLTVDVGGSAYDVPEYAINGVVMGFINGFVSGGPNSQSGTATIPVTAGQTFSFIMRATDDILGAAVITYSNFTAPGNAGNPIVWYTTPTGGTSIGTSASGANFPVTPGSTITYYAEAVTAGLGCISTSRTPVTVTVNTYSTDPVMAGLSSSYCPNTNITLSAGGGTTGSGSNIYWYTGPNGTGSFVGTGASIVVAPSATTTYYVRREGTCNISNDDVDVVVLKNYIYAANGTSTSSYCTDNSGWHHFYVGDDIILSIQGNLSSAGTVTATIGDNGAYYLDPGSPALCASGINPGETQFEMERNWNIGYTGSLIGSYDIRYYFEPAERTNVINAANAWIAANPACSYTYKYTINPNGWFWFKNQGTAYTAPDYDDDGTFTMLASGGAGTTPNGINYATMAGVTSFSGGTGGVILLADPLLNTAWLYFDGETNNKTNFLRWATESEQNSAHFNIQRSKDGVNFTTIGTVGAQGNSTTTQHYTFNDETPFTGDNYYRLELVGTDAKIAYSNTIRLVIADDGRGYSFYPNPTQNIVNYQYEATEKAPLEIEVIDVYGRTLLKKQVTTQVGLNRIPVNLTEFAAGAYMIRVNHLNSGNVHVNKVILDK
jgi:hypothetical protein